MRRVRILTLVASLALAGCASQSTDDSGLKSAPTGVETQQRTSARVHTELAANYFEIGNMGVALEEVKEALNSDPNYGPAHNIAGLVYARLKDDRTAEQSFQRAISINPSDYDANNNYGLFLCERRRERESIKYFLTAVRNPLYPFPDRSYVNAGVCARRAGDLADAEDYLQMALKIRPNQTQALYQLADMAYARGDYAGTRVYLTRLTQVASANPEVLWLGVRTARRLNDRNAEASYALQLRNRYPESSETRALNAGQYE
jgi:type IV pilus assembly protein PilF